MFDKNKITEKILKEIRVDVHEIDPSFDIIETLHLYFELLDYKHNDKTNDEIIKWHLENSKYDDKNLENNKREDISALEKDTTKFLTNFFDNQIQDSDVLRYCKSFEFFLKKLYYVLEENDEIDPNISVNPLKKHPMGPFLSSINRLFKNGINNQKEIKYEEKPGMLYNQNRFSFDDYGDVEDDELNENYANTFLLYIIKARILRNLDSHQMPIITISQRAEYFKATTIAKVHILNFAKDKLKNCFLNYYFKNQNFEPYIKKINDTYESKNKKFVSLTLSEWSDNDNSINSDIDTILKTKGYNQIRILGNGGAGKTTTLENLLFKDALNYKKNKSVPVLIALTNIPKNITLIEFISKKIFVDTEECLELLAKYRIRLYLDGLNEISKNQKKIIIQEIDDILKKYENLQVVVTDRHDIDNFQNDWFNIPTFIIDPLDENKIKEFITKQCENDVDLSSNVLKKLEEKLIIKDLVKKPLILTRAIDIIIDENELPDSEGKIIEKFIDLLLKREKNEKKDPFLNIDDFKLTLAYLSDEMEGGTGLINVPISIMAAKKIVINAHTKFGFESPALHTIRIACELEILEKNDEQIKFFHQSYFEWFNTYFLMYIGS